MMRRISMTLMMMMTMMMLMNFPYVDHVLLLLDAVVVSIALYQIVIDSIQLKVIHHSTYRVESAPSPILAESKLPYRIAVSYTHLRAHETVLDLVCRLLL